MKAWSWDRAVGVIYVVSACKAVLMQWLPATCDSCAMGTSEVSEIPQKPCLTVSGVCWVSLGIGAGG